MQQDINNGVPVVGLEPACVAVFRDELMNLFPGDEVAKRLSRQTYFFSEFLLKKAPQFRYPQLARKVMLHGHCHQKALIRMEDEETVLENMGVDLESLDSGCCGMAGSFGFDKDKYDVSIQVGELVLLPAVRNATARNIDRCRRLQLPGANCPNHRPQWPAYSRSDPHGTAEFRCDISKGAG